MKKALFLILGISTTIIIVLAIYFKFIFKSNIVSPSMQISPTPTPAEELIIWKDQSGFSFQYPKSLKLDPHDEDQENYAHLELTSATHSGSLVVWTKDTLSETIEDWVKQQKVEGAIETTLGEEPAKKILTNEGNRKLAITTIYGGYLYQIEVNLEDYDFWNGVHEKVFSSFKFIPTEEKTEGETKQQYVPEENVEGDIEEEIIE